MDDLEIANKLVDAGVARKGHRSCSYYLLNREWNIRLCGLFEEKFVRDWRVAGACLKAWPTTINTEHLNMTLDEMLRDPRAIIEAYVNAKAA